MTKRVIDIISPERKRPEPRPSVFEKRKKPNIKLRIKRKGQVLGGFAGLVVISGFLAFFFLSQAKIEVWPTADTLHFSAEITVDKNVSLTDFGGKIVPGKIFEKEKTLTENFPATGKATKEKKAEGIIRVYNAYSTYLQVLVASTRFVSTDGQIFRTPTKVTIPGGTYQGGKLLPGEIDIKVVADEPGAEYNIGPSTFSIPGFAGTDRYTKFYAKSFEPMAGGFITQASQITQEDLDKAENSLVKKAKEGAEAGLREEVAGKTDYYFLEKTLQTEVVEKLSLARVGEAAENFNYQVKAKSGTLLFKKDDLITFTKDFISSQIPSDKKMAAESLEINFTTETVNLKTGKANLSLEISVTIYSDLNLADLKQSILGKSLLEAKLFLENQPAITKSKIELWPFWVKSVPKDLNKVDFRLRVD